MKVKMVFFLLFKNRIATNDSILNIYMCELFATCALAVRFFKGPVRVSKFTVDFKHRHNKLTMGLKL